MNRFNFSQSELDRVPEAIRTAEAKTSAEFFAVLARRSDDYRFVAYSFCALWVFLLSGVCALWLMYQSANASWGKQGGVSVWLVELPTFVFAQIAAFVAIVLLLRLFPSYAVRIAPERIRHERARANGIRQFLAHGVDRTTGRNGVLVFVSLDEHYGEIYCDREIELALGQAFFLQQVEKLTEHCADGEVIEGFESVIKEIGEALEASFPVGAGDNNELEDRFVLLPE